MKYLTWFFVALGGYGLATDHAGAGLLSLCVAGLAYYGNKKMQADEAAFNAHPDRAKAPPDTMQLLERNNSESSRSTF